MDINLFAKGKIKPKFQNNSNLISKADKHKADKKNHNSTKGRNYSNKNQFFSNHQKSKGRFNSINVLKI